MKRWQNNIPEYLISPLTTGFRKISIGVVKDSDKVRARGLTRKLVSWLIRVDKKICRIATIRARRYRIRRLAIWSTISEQQDSLYQLHFLTSNFAEGLKRIPALKLLAIAMAMPRHFALSYTPVHHAHNGFTKFNWYYLPGLSNRINTI
ncbi:hypothetical protein [Endozoicomonas atrinae]|uniref:hypothetical protein n=1 Tax=Endozoicomonas atrinae TaxID=1333660 RepID=UPI003B00D651